MLILVINHPLIILEQYRFLHLGFLIYASFIIVAAIISIFLIAPRFGQRNPLVFVFISGSIGSLSVMACKGIGLGIKEAVENGILTVCTQWIFWFFLLGLAFCLSVQLNYLNRALDIFNTSVVTPLLYVFFTAFVLIASAILFKEGSTLTVLDYIGNVVGLTCIVSGIALLTLFKHSSSPFASSASRFGRSYLRRFFSQRHCKNLALDC
ncbi:unnamed protein product [Schistocephalus solidus]|uniref:Magnesium transporter NIPA2 n=1 Tax=Schistocephalus solidus TaxID=70667 RepID=A0A183T9L7_SCHSO|nr:unnamed protein product [Schistocephalus solidus]